MLNDNWKLVQAYFDLVDVFNDFIRKAQLCFSLISWWTRSQNVHILGPFLGPEGSLQICLHDNTNVSCRCIGKIRIWTMESYGVKLQFKRLPSVTFPPTSRIQHGWTRCSLVFCFSWHAQIQKAGSNSFSFHEDRQKRSKCLGRQFCLRGVWVPGGTQWYQTGGQSLVNVKNCTHGINAIDQASRFWSPEAE